MSKRYEDVILPASKYPVKIFWSYAHENRLLKDKLEKHFAALKHSGQVIMWSDREIQVGMLWEREINGQLEDADLFIPLISDDFINSRYCWGVEWKRMMERYLNGDAHIAPILLTPTDSEDTALNTFQMLPSDQKAITQWANIDEACLAVVKGIRPVIKKLIAQRCHQEGTIYRSMKRYEEAYTAYKDALCIDPENALILTDMGEILCYLGQFEKAIPCFEKVLRLKESVRIYEGLGNAYKGFAPQSYDKLMRIADLYHEKARQLRANEVKTQEGIE